MQGHLFHYCLDKAAEYKLFVKLHTGYFAGSDGMTLKWVRDNASISAPSSRPILTPTLYCSHRIPLPGGTDCSCETLFRTCTSICAGLDTSPVASVRFLKEFLAAAPMKLFTFGGDYLPIEMSIGHASMARRASKRSPKWCWRGGWKTRRCPPLCTHHERQRPGMFQPGTGRPWCMSGSTACPRNVLFLNKGNNGCGIIMASCATKGL